MRRIPGKKHPTCAILRRHRRRHCPRLGIVNDHVVHRFDAPDIPDDLSADIHIKAMRALKGRKEGHLGDKLSAA